MKKIFKILCSIVLACVMSITIIGCEKTETVQNEETENIEYSVSVVETEHIVIAPNKSKAINKEEVTVSYVIDEGYELVMITVNGARITENKFVINGENAVIKAYVKQIENSTEIEKYEFKYGSYIMVGEWQDNYITNASSGRDSFNSVKVNNDGSCDAYVFISETGLTKIHVNSSEISRVGNTLIVTSEYIDGSISVELLKNDAFIITCPWNDHEINLAFAYKEDKTFSSTGFSSKDGYNYYYEAQENGEFTLTVKQPPASLPGEEILISSQVGTYEVVGNRMYIKIEDKTYLGVLYTTLSMPSETLVNRISIEGYLHKEASSPYYQFEEFNIDLG